MGGLARTHTSDRASGPLNIGNKPMKLLPVSLGLLFLATGMFFIPVAFSVEGFGFVVSTHGLKTVRATMPGNVIHFEPGDKGFEAGQIVTAVVPDEADTKNALALRELRRATVELETAYKETSAQLDMKIARARAKIDATRTRLAARQGLLQKTTSLLNALEEFDSTARYKETALIKERAEHLSRLEEIAEGSIDRELIADRQFVEAIDGIRTGQLSVLSSERSNITSVGRNLNLEREVEDIEYDITIDRSEVDVLTDEIAALRDQLQDAVDIRETGLRKARAHYLVQSIYPQIAIAKGTTTDIRKFQDSYVTVGEHDQLRLLDRRHDASGLSIALVGIPSSGQLTLDHSGQEIALSFPLDPTSLGADLDAAGLTVKSVSVDTATIGRFQLLSYFVALHEPDLADLRFRRADGLDANDVPVKASAMTIIAGPDKQDHDTLEIMGFLENQNATALTPGQVVRGSFRDPRNGAQHHFEARLASRESTAVDTDELGIRIGNQSLAKKIISRGVISQVALEVPKPHENGVLNLQGAIVHLNFPLAQQTLFDLLNSRIDRDLLDGRNNQE